MKTSTRRRVRGYGWQNDLPDEQDFPYARHAPLPATATLRFPSNQSTQPPKIP